MIVKGIVRKATAEWKDHLIRADHNEEVRIVTSSGIAATSIPDMVQELQDYAIGTRCDKPLFEVIVNPDRRRAGTDADKYAAVQMVRKQYPALEGVPFFIVAHTKDGVEHWHIIFARCRPQQKAVELPFTKTRLMEVSAAMYERMKLEPPKGVRAFMDGQRDRERQDVDHSTFKAAERQGIDARDLSALVVDAWKGGDFAASMKKAGYEIAAGDRRGFVLVDHTGNVTSLRGLLKPLGLKAKEIRAVLGEPEQAKNIEQARAALQPPALSGKFDLAAADKTPPEIIKLKKTLNDKKAAMDDIKERHRRAIEQLESVLTESFRYHASLTEEDHAYMAEYRDEFPELDPSGRTPAQAAEFLREWLRKELQQQRQTLAESIKRDRDELKRRTLRQHGDRLVQFMRDQRDRVFAAWDRVKADLLRPPAKQPTPTPQPPQEVIGPLKSTRDLFRDTLKEITPEPDRSRDRDRSRTPPTRPKGPTL